MLAENELPLFKSTAAATGQDIYFVDMDYVDESAVVMFTVKLTLPCNVTWEKTDFTI